MKLLIILILILILIYLYGFNQIINEEREKKNEKVLTVSEITNVTIGGLSDSSNLSNISNLSEEKISVNSELKESCINPIIYDYINSSKDTNNKEEFLNLNSLIDDSEVLVSSNNFNNFDNISFKKINPNKLYYGLDCKYIKNDSFYNALKELGFESVDNINTTLLDACLIVPCSYETTEKEVVDLEAKGIKYNTFKDGVRIFMLNNTDQMVSKLALWQNLSNRYGENVASTMVPYTWDLTNEAGINKFKKDYDKTKLYITKNNLQRQEGIKIHDNLNSILDVENKLIVQELLQNPYLIKGRKINLRVYVLVIRDTNNNFKVLVYTDGFMYYTPELFEPNSSDIKKNITTGYIDREVYEQNPLTHQDFREYLDSNRNLTPIEKYIKNTKSNVKLSEHVFSQIYHLLAYIFETYNDILGTKTNGVSFQLYGVDVAIDDQLRPQVMEINKGPDLGAKDDRDKKLKLNLCKDMLKSVDLVDNDSSNKFINVLEQVNIDGKIYNINDFSN